MAEPRKKSAGGRLRASFECARYVGCPGAELDALTEGGRYGPLRHSGSQISRETQVAADRSGIRVEVADVQSLQDLHTLFEQISGSGVEALLVQPDNLLNQIVDGEIAELAARHRLPLMLATRNAVRRAPRSAGAP